MRVASELIGTRHDTIGSGNDNCQVAAAAAQRSTVFRTVARIGYVVLGILHIVIGVLAVSFVTRRWR